MLIQCHNERYIQWHSQVFLLDYVLCRDIQQVYEYLNGLSKLCSNYTFFGWIKQLDERTGLAKDSSEFTDKITSTARTTSIFIIINIFVITRILIVKAMLMFIITGIMGGKGNGTIKNIVNFLFKS